MKILKTILNIATMILISFGLISFTTHNVADAIFAVVVAILIRQGVSEFDRNTT